MARYKIDGKEYPSVTEIISDCTNNSAPLTQWAANQCKEWVLENCEEDIWHLEDEIITVGRLITDKQLDEMRFNFRKVSQKALDVGSEVHNLIEQYLKGNEVDLLLVGEQVYNTFSAFLDWSEEHNLKPISLEQTVYTDRWAGMLDFYGYFNGKLYVIDWKSSKAHYPEMRYQVAAYRRAMGESIVHWNLIHNKTQPTPKGCGVLRLDKETGIPDWKDTSKTYEKDLEVFNRMVDLYYTRHPRIAKKVMGE